MEHIHFIGIKGVGMAALAVAAKEKGYLVTGSDGPGSFVTDEELKKHGIHAEPFDVKNLSSKPQRIVVSAAYGKDNPEVKEARKKKMNLVTYSDMLAYLTQDSDTIAVAGVHGKTTTTALVSFLLKQAGMDPGFVIGSGDIPALKSNGHFGKGNYFVVEADEYRKSSENNQSKFLDLKPKIEVITSIELDHPDIFSSLEEIYQAFFRFACQVSREGFIVLNIDYPKSRKLRRSIADRNFETYGFSQEAAWQITDFKEDEEKTIFSLSNNGIYGPFELTIPGEGNVLNATAAIIIALKLGVSEDIIKKSLPLFSGVKRRFEEIAKSKDIIIIDDYAHHPRAITLTLEAARHKYPNTKIWCIFQPHTYSRTKALLGEFSQAFKPADKVIITDIYASAREKDAVISSQQLVDEIKKNHSSVKLIKNWDSIIEEVKKSARRPLVIFTMGAGDIYKLSEELKKVV